MYLHKTNIKTFCMSMNLLKLANEAICLNILMLNKYFYGLVGIGHRHFNFIERKLICMLIVPYLQGISITFTYLNLNYILLNNSASEKL